MSETDHVHERGRSLEQSIPAYQCAYCDMEAWAEDWEIHEAAIAAVQKHGLPDHAERVAAARDAALGSWSRSLEGLIRDIVHAYLTWAKEEVES